MAMSLDVFHAPTGLMMPKVLAPTVERNTFAEALIAIHVNVNTAEARLPVNTAEAERCARRGDCPQEYNGCAGLHSLSRKSRRLPEAPTSGIHQIALDEPEYSNTSFDSDDGDRWQHLRRHHARKRSTCSSRDHSSIRHNSNMTSIGTLSA